MYNFSDGESVENVAEIAERVYDGEVAKIKQAGELWPMWIGVVIAAGAYWGISELLGHPWDKHDFNFVIIFGIVMPFLWGMWKKYEAGSQLRHEREVRMEIKLDALVELIKIGDLDDMDESGGE